MGAPPRLYHCPSCGGPCEDAGSRTCTFCSGPLVPLGTPDPRHAVRCGACGSLEPEGGSFCSQCGDPLVAAPAIPVEHHCPACRARGRAEGDITLGAETMTQTTTGTSGSMVSWQLQPSYREPTGHAVHGCRRCGGVWVDRTTLDAMLAAAARRVLSDGQAANVHRRALSLETKVVYRPCAVCSEAMIRRNFAKISGVIVDQCREHGSFFDAGELEDVLAFVHSGGLVLSQRRETEALRREAERQRSARDTPRSGLMREVEPMTGMPLDAFDGSGVGLDLGVAFARWAGRWIRNMFR